MMSVGTVGIARDSCKIERRRKERDVGVTLWFNEAMDRIGGSQVRGKHITSYTDGGASVTIRYNRSAELFSEMGDQKVTTTWSADCSENREANRNTHTARTNRTSSSRDATPAALLQKCPELTLLPVCP